VRQRLWSFALLLGLTTAPALSARPPIAVPTPKELFYNPGNLPAGNADGSVNDPTSGLRAIHFVSPFPARGHVGIHYWLETRDGTRVATTRARVDVTYALHMRSNTEGLLTVWSDPTGLQLTPMQSQWAGYRLDAGHEYVVAGTFRPARSTSEGTVFVFARSQTEVPRTADGTREKLRLLSGRLAADGLPSLVSETDEETTGQIGTYVVNRDGNQPAAEIPLTPVGS
jgi:hypothetical protein